MKLLEDIDDTLNVGSRRREVKVTFDDGDYLFTTINGSTDEVESYYIGQSFETFNGMHKAIKVEFLN
jgi:hypothetical protein